MPTLIVGVLVVAVSTAGFALTMFGRRPLPQPATTTAAAAPTPVTPSREAGAAPRRRRSTTTAAVDREVPRLQVDVPASVRIRSAFLLALGVIAAAAAVGVVLSIVVVGFFTLIG